MHATTSKNGMFVSLYSDLDIEKGTAKFVVTTTYGGKYRKTIYTDFSKAAAEYRALSDKIENGKE